MKTTYFDPTPCPNKADHFCFFTITSAKSGSIWSTEEAGIKTIASLISVTSHLERSAAARHVCTLAACFSQSSEDAPLQTLLSVTPSSVFVVPVKWLVIIGHVNFPWNLMCTNSDKCLTCSVVWNCPINRQLLRYTCTFSHFCMLQHCKV